MLNYVHPVSHTSFITQKLDFAIILGLIVHGSKLIVHG